MRKMFLFVLVAIFVFTGCQVDGIEDKSSDSSSRYVVNDANVQDHVVTPAPGQMVQLVYATPEIDQARSGYYIRARRGQPFAGPSDGSLTVYYRTRSCASAIWSQWRSQQMAKFNTPQPNNIGNDNILTDVTYDCRIALADSRDLLEFYLVLNVYGVTYYDRAMNNPFKVQSYGDFIEWGYQPYLTGYSGSSFYEASIRTMPNPQDNRKKDIYIWVTALVDNSIVPLIQDIYVLNGIVSWRLRLDENCDILDRRYFTGYSLGGWIKISTIGADQAVPNQNISVYTRFNNGKRFTDDFFGRRYGVKNGCTTR